MSVETNFRRTRWGMSRGQVVSSESTTAVIDNAETLAFAGQIVGFPCTIFYGFHDGRLVDGSYVIDQDNDIADVDAFLELSKSLESKYGEPVRNMEWKDPSRYRRLETLAEVAKAVATGDVSEISAEWQVENTWVRLVITEDKQKYNAFVVLIYRDLRHVEDVRMNYVQKDLDML
jgi:hypothetical protein